ncbi:MAG: crotonase [Deltaproteobacteria bacterium]|nr:crotonase [Deltaproteobacteria bacterium]
MTTRPDYFDRYDTLAFERTDNGILTLRLHSNGGPVVYQSAHHRDWAHAFLDIAADRENRVVILTGTGDAFIDAYGWDIPLEDGESWDRIHWEAKRVLSTLLDIDVPIIGAVNGPATIHAELAVLSDITLASETATFQDAAHIPFQVAPGDGVHIVWQELLGSNRGRYFLLTSQVLSAQEALELGVVNEVVPPEQLMARAMELAEQLAALPTLTLRHSRVALTQRWKRLMLENLGYGLSLEGLTLLHSS